MDLKNIAEIKTIIEEITENVYSMQESIMECKKGKMIRDYNLFSINVSRLFDTSII